MIGEKDFRFEISDFKRRQDEEAAGTFGRGGFGGSGIGALAFFRSSDFVLWTSHIFGGLRGLVGDAFGSGREAAED
ncbi:MAG TPA: hypothetical protein VF669_22215 [Tepidisphaeraceae bacterium]|jgi:hypothetical protein